MTQKIADNFVSSLADDIRLAPYDIAGSVAHATMLGKKGIIPKDAAGKIIRGLNDILKDMRKGKDIAVGEDIHFAIEKELIRRVGAPGRMLHTARSRNDQVVTDLHLYLKDQIRQVCREIKNCQQAILFVAGKNKSVVMPGFTHLQHAQPVLFAHHLLAYAWMLERDVDRMQDLLKRVDVLPLGSAALAGTSFPIDRSMVARLLKFKGVSENSIDATASRDVAIEFLSAGAILMSNLSRLAEELVIWSSSEFSFVELAETWTTGSSIMPQKRNPDMAELLRGKTGRVFGSLMSLLTIVKGTPLAYNRDLQETKPPVFDAAETLLGSLQILSPMMKTMKVNAGRMKKVCDAGFPAATELADFLVKQGVPFRSAHGVIQALVKWCDKKEKRLDQLTPKELKKFHSRLDESALAILKPEQVVRAKTSHGGTSPESVRHQIQKLSRLIS